MADYLSNGAIFSDTLVYAALVERSMDRIALTEMTLKIMSISHR